jgi:transposase
MQTGTTIGLDIAKSVFRAQGVDAEGLVVIRRQLVVIRRQLKRRYVLTFI